MRPVIGKLRRLAGLILRAIPWVRRRVFAPSDYKVITLAEARAMQLSGWFSPRTARRQEQAYESLLQDMRAGHPRIDFVVAAEALRACKITNPKILEAGCGNGYYAEVFDCLLQGPFTYTGIDSAEPMIKSASRRYPQHSFHIADAAHLPFPDRSFDVVFNGVSLMHILDYEKAIAESARLTARACIFHSVPVFQNRQTTYLRKYGYGSPMWEIVFNEPVLAEIFAQCGLKVQNVWPSIPYDVSHVTGEHSETKTYLCMLDSQERVS